MCNTVPTKFPCFAAAGLCSLTTRFLARPAEESEGRDGRNASGAGAYLPLPFMYFYDFFPGGSAPIDTIAVANGAISFQPHLGYHHQQQDSLVRSDSIFFSGHSLAK